MAGEGSNIGGLAAAYAAKGWKVVKLYGMAGPGRCACRKGRDCPTPGKHPVGDAWDTRASSDEETIMSWFDGTGHWNIGLLLGPKSGVIDVELDGDDAKRAWDSLGLGEVWTPTYTAGRGPHRLFLWDDRLPPVTVVKPLGIEVRIGQGDRRIQSVLPPSMHHTGKQYAWVPGLSPDDIDPQPLPEQLVALLWNDDGTGSSGAALKKPARLILREGAVEGSRNNDLYRYAVRCAFRFLNIDDPQEQTDLLATIQAVNLTKCRPPLSEDEVMSIYQNAIAYRRKNDVDGFDAETAIARAEIQAAENKARNAPVERSKNLINTFTEHGLSYAMPAGHRDPEWGPGNWHLTVVHSDPLEYRLLVPAWRRMTANGTGFITLTVDQYRSATKVAAAVLAATGVVMLDAQPGNWKKIWDGGYKVTDPTTGTKRAAKGVKAKLLDSVGHEYPGASSLRYVILAGWLYDRLAQASQPADDDAPDSTGRSAWRKDGTLWFGWSRVWEDIERQHRVLEGERIALKRRLLAVFGVGEFVHSEYRHAGGTRRSYVVWSRAEFGALERLANEVEPMPDDWAVGDVRQTAPSGASTTWDATASSGAGLPPSSAPQEGGALVGEESLASQPLDGDRQGEGSLEGSAGEGDIPGSAGGRA